MSFNPRLHDAVVEAFEAAMADESANLIAARNADFGELRYRMGRIHGLMAALEVAEETRKRMAKE